VVAGLASAGVFAVTLVWPDWIEVVFRVQPDHASGWLEWLISGTAFLITLVFSFGAGRAWRRATLRAAGATASA